MDHLSEETASLYVLDLLPPAEKAAFEARLLADPELATHVAGLRDALFVSARNLPGKPRPDLLKGIHDRISLAPSSSPKQPSGPVLLPRSSFIPWSWLWAAAALILLGFNISLFLQTRQPVSLMPTAPLAMEVQHKAAPDVTEREHLAGLNRRMAMDTRRWEQAYMQLAARTLPYFIPESGVSRFTVIEMGSPGQRGHGVGHNAIARQLMLGQGPRIQSAELTVEQEPVAFVASSTDRVSLGESSLERVLPSGFSVWRDDEQRGLLRVFNLPRPARGSAPFLWVRASDLEGYHPVGFLPRLSEGSGSLSYTVAEPAFTPAELLITEEDALFPGTQPSDRVLLVGP